MVKLVNYPKNGVEKSKQILKKNYSSAQIKKLSAICYKFFKTILKVDGKGCEFERGYDSYSDVCYYIISKGEKFYKNAIKSHNNLCLILKNLSYPESDAYKFDSYIWIFTSH